MPDFEDAEQIKLAPEEPLSSVTGYISPEDRAYEPPRWTRKFQGQVHNTKHPQGIGFRIGMPSTDIQSSVLEMSLVYLLLIPTWRWRIMTN